MTSSPAGAGAAAGAGGGDRQPRRGPAPFASFDHDVSDEVRPDSSPEGKLTFQLPEIREDRTSPGAESGAGGSLGVPESRARSHSSPAVSTAGLRAPPAPRIDISRASSSSHQDSRDSSPDLALFPSELSFREEGALDLRSSTEELAFLEGAPSGPHAAPTTPVPSATAPASRRHSRKDSQGSEVALLGVMGLGRTDRLASVGSQGSAVSRLSRSPSPHRMLLETSFCGPRPLDNEPDLCERRLLEIAAVTERRESAPAPLCPAPRPCEVRAEVTVEALPSNEDKQSKEWKNRAVAAERRRARSRLSVSGGGGGGGGDIVRIRLKPDEEYDDDDEPSPAAAPCKPATLQLRAPRSPPARSPSPAAGTSPRKTSFSSLFRASPESPGGGARRKQSLSDGRPRSTSRDRSAGLRGSVLSLFRSSRRTASSPPPPLPATAVITAAAPASPAPPTERLKYYEETRDGIIHIPLRTPPDDDSTVVGEQAVPTSSGAGQAPLKRTVLPDGSIIIPLHSPTESRPGRAQHLLPSLPTPRRVQPQSPPATTSAPAPASTPSSPPATSSPPLQALSTEVRATIEQCEPPPEVSTRASSRQHVVFRTQVGIGGQVFSTQLSVIKTPSLSSELSVESTFEASVEAPVVTSAVITPTVLSSPAQVVDVPLKYEEHGTSTSTEGTSSGALDNGGGGKAEALPSDARVDSSESEASSGAGRARGGEEGERRGLVLGQESFDDELPYVPTTLPLERSQVLPMVPVRERGGVRVSALQRPRPAAPAAGPLRTPPPRAPPPSTDKIRISLPQGSGRGAQPRVRSSPIRTDWIDFEEVPERRKQPKRIQTLPRGSGSGVAGSTGVAAPAAALVDPAATGGEGVMYVAPEHCRCECHHRNATNSGPSTGECGAEECGGSGARGASGAAGTSCGARTPVARPFTADLDLRPDEVPSAPRTRPRSHPRPR